MRVITIVGARPQFIKASPVSKALAEAGHHEFLIHTGQHYDDKMSRIFFDHLEIPEPQINLAVGSGDHGQQTGQMLIEIEKVLLAEKPDCVLVYGDTNSTLAGALAACKLHLRLAHIEAGLRSFNKEMPEEHNRVIADHCADLLFCPTQTAVDNLAKENVTEGVHLVGDTMYDAVLQFSEIGLQRSTILQDLNLQSKGFLLATVHRSYNTDLAENLLNIFSAFAELEETVIFPVHPRTRQKMSELEGAAKILEAARNIRMIEPLGYLDMLVLERHARMILTDSGGMQKEAYFFETPCVTLRPETEWVETVNEGWNVLVGADKAAIVQAIHHRDLPEQTQRGAFGDGQAAKHIVGCLEKAQNGDENQAA